MTKTVQIQVSDATIKRLAADSDVFELKDPRHPVRFRYRKCRTRGSWHVVLYDQGGKWKKAGNWPDVSARSMIESLPAVLARLVVDPASKATVDEWETVGELLEWYSDRVRTDRGLSASRRSSAHSAIKCHLAPQLGVLRLDALNKSRIDDRLIRPMKSNDYSLAHIKSVFGVLQVACRRAHALEKITENPLKGVVFSSFSKEVIPAKAARLRYVHVVGLLDEWAVLFESQPADVAFAVMMLAHGSRISETRQAKWRDLHLDVQGEWFIPSTRTKSKRDHRLPLTAQVVAFLSRYRDRQRAGGYDGAYLFPSLSDPGQPISRSHSFEIFQRLGLGEWSSHDLRKLARTTWGDMGADSLVAKLLLNHALSDLEATYYQSSGQALKRKALSRWHSWLDDQGFSALHSKTEARQREVRTPTDPASYLA